MTPLVIDDFRDVFPDEASFERFVQVLTDRLGNDLSPIIFNDKVLGAVLSQAAAKDVLYERMVRKIADSPEILDEVRHRIENEDVIE